MVPRMMRKADETDEPMIPPISEKESNRSLIAAELAATTMAVTMTIVLCPREKKVPTVTGRWPEATRRRVQRSMAAMWSASRAWRRPSV
jgi:hypothetical protein